MACGNPVLDSQPGGLGPGHPDRDLRAVVAEVRVCSHDTRALGWRARVCVCPRFHSRPGGLWPGHPDWDLRALVAEVFCFICKRAHARACGRVGEGGGPDRLVVKQIGSVRLFKTTSACFIVANRPSLTMKSR